MKSRAIILTTINFICQCTLFAQVTRTPQITPDELRLHVKYLASDELEGRLAGSMGADKAAAYIASEFKSYGLQPMGDQGTYLQHFDFVAGVTLGSKNGFVVKSGDPEVVLSLDRDFRPLGFSSSATFSGEVVFAGYGISAPDKDYDDYQGIDVKGKAVIVLRYAPAADTGRSEFEKYSSLRFKAARAKELGARALLVVTGPLDADKDDLIKLSYDQSVGNAGIPAVNLTRNVVNKILQARQVTVEALQNSLVKTKKPSSTALDGITVRLTTDVVEVRKQTANVVGFLEGHDETMKGDVIVVGAHYDHLGYGGEGSGSRAPDTVAVHHGADDNASGTAGLLELAQAFSSERDRLKRSLLFVSFSGEEEGVLGSSYFVNNPTIPLHRVVTMVNMDMIGRLNNRKLIVNGTGTSQGFDSLVIRHNADSTFVLSLVKDGFGPSDQTSFYAKQIPVYFFWTDLHADYHLPSDTWDKINYKGEADIVRFVKDITEDLDRTPKKPAYLAVEMPKASGTEGRGYRVSVGTIPDFGEQVDGYKLGGVREGSPAAKAGLQAGDIIVKFGKVDVKNIYDFTYALGEYKPGDVVDVVLKRGKETVNTKVVLERKN